MVKCVSIQESETLITNRCKYATVSWPGIDKNGKLLGACSVSFSDAPTPWEHIHAQEVESRGEQSGYTFIVVFGFRHPFETNTYCRRHNLTPV